MSISFLNDNIYVKEEHPPIVKMHYPEKLELNTDFQRALGNLAIVICMSDYASKGDKKYADLRQAKNDVKAIRDFLLESYVKFKEENIIILTDPSIETLKEVMEQFKKDAIAAGLKGPTNIFLYISCHGASVDSQLQICCPTVITKEEFSTLRDDLPEINIDDLKTDLIDFNVLEKKVGIDFSFKTMIYEPRVIKVKPEEKKRFKEILKKLDKIAAQVLLSLQKLYKPNRVNPE